MTTNVKNNELGNMSMYLHIRRLSPNHVAKSIIITPTNLRPSFLRNAPYLNNSWPTPAMRTYHRVVSIPFAKFFWEQNELKRKTLLGAVSRELFHEGGGRVYKRLPGTSDVLVKQSLDDFQEQVSTRLNNIRYDQLAANAYFDYENILSGYSVGEKVMVETRTSMIYEGLFQFDSVINSNYCYIKFDSRAHVIKWEKILVKHIDLRPTATRMVTRQMTRMLHAASTNEVPNSAVARHDQSSLTFPPSNIENSEEFLMNRNNVLEHLPGGNSYSHYIHIFGDGTENMTTVDGSWLTKQGFTKNKLSDQKCYICHNDIDKDYTVYNIKCGDKLLHPLHRHCVQEYIDHKGRSCPACRFEWE